MDDTEDTVDQNETLPRIIDNTGTSQQHTEVRVNQIEALQSIMANKLTREQLTLDTVIQNESLPRIKDNTGTSQQLTEVTVNQNEALPRIIIHRWYKSTAH